MSDTEATKGCQMCEPAPHPNCEVYTMLTIEDPANGGTRNVDVCLEHFEAVKP